MDNYKKMLKTRTQYATCIGKFINIKPKGTFDLGVRLAAFRWINAGWQRPYGGFEFNFIRKIPGSIFVAALTAPFSVPFEMARMTYNLKIIYKYII